MQKVYTGELHWKDQILLQQVFITNDESDLRESQPITQVYGICITPAGDAVLYRHAEGYYGMPGGKPEENESFQQTLAREIHEEVNCKVLHSQLVGYQKLTNTLTDTSYFQLRYVAIVEPLPGAIKDPAGASLDRKIVPFSNALELLGWGESGQELFEQAKKWFKHQKMYS